MNLENRLEACRICKNRAFHVSLGITCSKTNEQPTFEEKCSSFVLDELENRIIQNTISNSADYKEEDVLETSHTMGFIPFSLSSLKSKFTRIPTSLLTKFSIHTD